MQSVSFDWNSEQHCEVLCYTSQEFYNVQTKHIGTVLCYGAFSVIMSVLSKFIYFDNNKTNKKISRP